MQANRIAFFQCMIRLLPFFCVLLFGTNCSDNSTHPPEFALELQQEMDRFLDEKMLEYNIPGAVIGIWVPGRGTWLKAKGKADIEENTDMNLTHTFRIGSISKTFNATIILQLVDEGLLSLRIHWTDLFHGFPIRKILQSVSSAIIRAAFSITVKIMI